MSSPSSSVLVPYRLGNGRDVPPGADGLQHNFTAVLKLPRGLHAVITETLAGFEYQVRRAVQGRFGLESDTADPRAAAANPPALPPA